ncbi:unnamed protein product [Adineta steineri]|uniref:Uncharacterized protein n=1 Tax=Adineta steineri TaxID=433720 RepID=A0A815SYU8_9BILA|nr:unnamed protein product [Adineta steineri]
MSVINDMHMVTSNDTVRTEQPKEHVMTYPPPSYSQADTETIPAPYQNEKETQVLHTENVMDGPSPVVVNPVYISDYLCWSIFNTLCCLWPVGLIAIIMSVIVNRKLRKGDIKGARTASTWAKIMNGVATIGGIIIIILYNYIHFFVNKKNEFQLIMDELSCLTLKLLGAIQMLFNHKILKDNNKSEDFYEVLNISLTTET